jgi:hypothetical protein
LSQLKRRANQTPAQNVESKEKERLRRRKSIADETLAQTEERQEKDRLRKRKSKIDETPAHREERLRKNRENRNKAKERHQRRRSIHEINISKDANYLEYIPTNKKTTSQTNNNLLKITKSGQNHPFIR